MYTKPYGPWLKAQLKQQVDAQTSWMPVGRNADMTAWPAMEVKDFPYPLDTALERFYTGDTQRLSVLLHYGQDAITADLPGWFHTYNGRQIIEAGIKEGKQVFQMHHLKVRSEAALFLQEHFAAFAANFPLGRTLAHDPVPTRTGGLAGRNAARRQDAGPGDGTYIGLRGMV